MCININLYCNGFSKFSDTAEQLHHTHGGIEASYPYGYDAVKKNNYFQTIDIALKLSRMIGPGVEYWLNLQNAYDALIAEFKSEDELKQERSVLETLDYKCFYKTPLCLIFQEKLTGK